jgi:hypothetical protein
VIILVAIFLFVAALVLFLTAKASVWLAFPVFAAPSFKLGSILILSSFTILLLAGLFLFFRQILNDLFIYFSSLHRVKRRTQFVKNKQHQIDSLLRFKLQKIKHSHRLSKNRLTEADDRRQIRSLSKAIETDLLSNKKKLPQATFKQLQRERAYFRVRKNGEALLKLQQKIAELI